MTDWINIEDKLPKNGERVLIKKDLPNHLGSVATFYAGDVPDCFYIMNSMNSPKVTHWRPIEENRK